MSRSSPAMSSSMKRSCQRRTGLRNAGTAHDFRRAAPLRCCQIDPCPSDMQTCKYEEHCRIRKRGVGGTPPAAASRAVIGGSGKPRASSGRILASSPNASDFFSGRPLKPVAITKHRVGFALGLRPGAPPDLGRAKLMMHRVAVFRALWDAGLYNYQGARSADNCLGRRSLPRV